MNQAFRGKPTVEEFLGEKERHQLITITNAAEFDYEEFDRVTLFTVVSLKSTAAQIRRVEFSYDFQRNHK